MKKASSDPWTFYILTLCLQCYSPTVESLSTRGTRFVPENELTSLATFIKYHSNTPLCSGTLVTGILVLTTAHCMSKAPMDQIQVFLGGNRIRDDSRYGIASCKKYSEWVTENNQIYKDEGVDIAFVQLSRKVVFTPKIGLALLPLDREVPIHNLKVSLVGWTKTCHIWARQTGNTETESAELCASHSKPELRPLIAEGKLFCTLSQTNLHAVDEGGPVLYNKRVLVGLNFWNQRSYARDVKNLHINYLYYRDFVRDMVYSQRSDELRE